MSLYYLILWNQVDILPKHFKKDHVHMRLWTRFYSIVGSIPFRFFWATLYSCNVTHAFNICFFVGAVQGCLVWAGGMPRCCTSPEKVVAWRGGGGGGEGESGTRAHIGFPHPQKSCVKIIIHGAGIHLIIHDQPLGIELCLVIFWECFIEPIFIKRLGECCEFLFRFLVGYGAGGVILCCFVLQTENLTSRYRALLATCSPACFALGLMVCGIKQGDRLVASSLWTALTAFNWFWAGLETDSHSFQLVWKTHFSILKLVKPGLGT